MAVVVEIGRERHSPRHGGDYRACGGAAQPVAGEDVDRVAAGLGGAEQPGPVRGERDLAPACG
jgi:hypothetical protein